MLHIMVEDLTSAVPSLSSLGGHLIECAAQPSSVLQILATQGTTLQVLSC